MTAGQWKRIHEKATGALPVATLTKWGAILISLLLAAFLLAQSLFNSAPEEAEPVASGAEEPAGPGTQAQIAARIREEAIRQEAQRQAAERDLQRRRELGLAAPDEATGNIPTTFPSDGAGANPIEPSSEAEAELREVLRLEEIERRRRSLRSAPVAQTYRVMNGTPPEATSGESAPRISDETQTAQNFQPPPAVNQALQQSLDMLGEAVADLEASATQAEQEGGLPTVPGVPGQALPPGLPEEAGALTGPIRDYENPTPAVAPADPRQLSARYPTVPPRLPRPATL